MKGSLTLYLPSHRQMCAHGEREREKDRGQRHKTGQRENITDHAI